MNFTILIGTCDKYSFLWKDFASMFNKYWDDRIEVNKYFLSETVSPEIEGFKSFTPGKIPYSDCIKYALNNITTPYVLWMQDDYFLRKQIPKERFDAYIKFITNNNVDRFCFNRYRPHTKYYSLSHINENLYKMDQNSNYTISMQSSIWNVDFFKSCLISDGHETPWEFEVNGTIRLNKTKTHKIFYEITEDYWYQEAMRKGSFTAEYYDIRQRENL